MTVPAILKNLRLPVIGSPLFIISGPELVIAQCKAGIVGSFPALNARPATLLDEWLHRITEELAAHNRDHPERPAAPFAVNQIVHKSNDRLESDLATCAKWQVPIVITSLGAREDLNMAVHGWGGITLHDVIDDRFARKAVEKGADGLIAVAAGRSGCARLCWASSSVIRCSHSSSSVCGRALSAGNDPTIPALHCAITSSGPEMMNSGEPMIGRRKERRMAGTVIAVS